MMVLVSKASWLSQALAFWVFTASFTIIPFELETSLELVAYQFEASSSFSQ